MNDGAEILRLQTTKRAISLLAAQRQLYADAKLLYLAYGAAVAIPPALVSVTSSASVVPLMLSVILPVVFGRVLTSLAEKRQCEAASVQQELDSYLYGLSLPNTDHDESLAALCCQRYKKKGVSDLSGWHPERIRGLQSGEAESECQKVSIRWTKDLAAMALLIDVLVAAAIMFVVVRGIMRSGASSIAYVLLTPVVEWVVECALDRCRLYTVAKGIKLSVENLGSDEEGQIRRIQNLIYECRCLRPVPDFLYRLTKDCEQWKADHTL